jgi:hypothetical protein
MELLFSRWLKLLICCVLLNFTLWKCKSLVFHLATVHCTVYSSVSSGISQISAVFCIASVISVVLSVDILFPPWQPSSQVCISKRGKYVVQIRGKTCSPFKAVLWNRNRNQRNRIILPKKNRNRILALGSGSGSGSCCTKNINLNLQYSVGTLADTCMKLAREETEIKITGRSFYRKNNLQF